jgi:hypothetical protein
MTEPGAEGGEHRTSFSFHDGGCKREAI